MPTAIFERALSILLDLSGEKKRPSPGNLGTASPFSVVACFERDPRTSTSVSPSERLLEHCPRLKMRSVLLIVDLLPDGLWCFDCERNARRDSSSAVPAPRRDLPYPALLPFLQSLLDRANEVDLADLVDGLNLPMEWADKAGYVDIDGRRRVIDWAPALHDWQPPFFQRPSTSKRAM
jgi:hypothetical protein